MSYIKEIESNPELMAESRDISRMLFVHIKQRELLSKSAELQSAETENKSTSQTQLKDLNLQLERCRLEIERLYRIRPALKEMDFGLNTLSVLTAT